MYSEASWPWEVLWVLSAGTSTAEGAVYYEKFRRLQRLVRLVTSHLFTLASERAIWYLEVRSVTSVPLPPLVPASATRRSMEGEVKVRRAGKKLSVRPRLHEWKAAVTATRTHFQFSQGDWHGDGVTVHVLSWSVSASHGREENWRTTRRRDF